MRTRFNRTAVRLFETVFRPWMYRRLGGVHVTGLPPQIDANRSVLLVANHVSWWDAFLLREAHRCSGSRAPLLTIMTAEQLRRFPFFQLMGVRGLSPSPASIRSALRWLETTKTSGPVWLTYFPQGRIWPSWRHPLGFQEGVLHFARVLAPATLLPVGLHLEPLAGTSPTAFVAIGEPVHLEVGATDLDVATLEGRVAEALLFIRTHLASWGEDAVRHWPGLHDPLPHPAAAPALLAPAISAP